jgi:hypothetical protein
MKNVALRLADRMFRRLAVALSPVGNWSRRAPQKTHPGLVRAWEHGFLELEIQNLKSET